MNNIQKYLLEKMIEALYRSAGELIANAKTDLNIKVDANEVSQSLIEFENAINANVADFKSNVKTDLVYLQFDGSRSSFVNISEHS